MFLQRIGLHPTVIVTENLLQNVVMVLLFINHFINHPLVNKFLIAKISPAKILIFSML